MNNYFSEAPKNIVRSLQPQSTNPYYLGYLTGNYNSSFYLRHITEVNIIYIVRGLNNTSGAGYLGNPSKVVKVAVDIIAKPLVKIFNSCIDMGYFPDAIKIAEVLPVFKAGDPMKPQSYRPISILSIFSKVFEKHIYNELSQYF